MLFLITDEEQEEIAQVEDLAYDLWFAKTPAPVDERTLEETIADDYEEGVW